MDLLGRNPERTCSIRQRNPEAGSCWGVLHQFDVQMYAELDGTPVHDAPVEKTYICAGHAPKDPQDPKYQLCICELCLIRKKQR